MTTEANDTAQGAVDALWHKLTMDIGDREDLPFDIYENEPPVHLNEQLTAIVEEYLKGIVRDEVDRLSAIAERIKYERPHTGHWVKETGNILESSIHQLQDYIGEVE
jgi:hypothetical protein|tara:strand:- start:1332 stop:1652 length:321 start_codon:yes stop_codon:yes gene_type:complete